MKRFFAIFICIATALIFVACTNNSETKSSKTETTQISAQNSGDEKSFASIDFLFYQSVPVKNAILLSIESFDVPQSCP